MNHLSPLTSKPVGMGKIVWRRLARYAAASRKGGAETAAGFTEGIDIHGKPKEWYVPKSLYHKVKHHATQPKTPAA